MVQLPLLDAMQGSTVLVFPFCLPTMSLCKMAKKGVCGREGGQVELGGEEAKPRVTVISVGLVVYRWLKALA
jgi:hypothetical protein